MAISLTKKNQYTVETFLAIHANWGRKYIDIFIAGNCESLPVAKFKKLDNIQFSIREKDYIKKGDIITER
jgi:hypothetical protein